MHKYIGFIAAAFSVLGATSIGLMFYAAFNNGGTAVLVFQSWFVICFIAALVFAVISRFMAKRVSAIPHGSTRLAIALSIITLLCLGLGLTFIG